MLDKKNINKFFTIRQKKHQSIFSKILLVNEEVILNQILLKFYQIHETEMCKNFIILFQK